MFLSWSHTTVLCKTALERREDFDGSEGRWKSTLEDPSDEFWLFPLPEIFLLLFLLAPTCAAFDFC